jgi:ABC-type sugar transport system substrate-binding protein
MKTTARKMSIFVFMAIATTTTLALGTSTAMAASKTHTHVTELKSSGDDWFPTSTAFVASNTHTHHHNMHLMSSNGNHLTGTNDINSIGSRNNDIP